MSLNYGVLWFPSYAAIAASIMNINIFHTIVIVFIFVYLWIFHCMLFERTYTNFSLLIGKGDSMYPHIPPGSTLVLTKKTDTYTVGDIISYVYEQNSEKSFQIMHRIVHKPQDELYITKGDNSDRCDNAFISKDMIYGRAVMINSKYPVFIPVSPIAIYKTVELVLRNVVTRVHPN